MVNLATCSNSSASPLVDSCPGADPLDAHTGTNNTYYNCSCMPNWAYKYPGAGPNVTFDGCANPDGDPRGAW